MQIATYDVIYWKSDITPLVSALEKLPWPVSKWTNTHFGFAILSTLCDVASWLAYTLLYSSTKVERSSVDRGTECDLERPGQQTSQATMKWTLATLALLGSASANPLISPRDDSCASSYNGQFEVTIAKVNKRDIQKRSCDNADALLLTLDGGILKDAKGRTGYIASNYQFQFDNPPQAGTIVASGFAVCQDGSLALQGKTTWYQCQSGNFYNLYDRKWAPHCQAVEITIIPCSGGSSGGGSGGSSGGGSNNNGSGGSGGETTVGTKVVQTTIVTAISDGQPQVHTTTIAIPICQIGDGQVQGHTTPCGGGGGKSPVTQISDGQPQVPPVTQVSDGQPQAPPVTQISDGQPQAPTGSAKQPVTQISDGQPQAPPAVTQISDGQPQAPPVTQISDGQPQAPTQSAKQPQPPAVTQISDGQPQAPPVTQISDGQPQAPPVTQISDGQPQAPTQSAKQPESPPVTQISDGQPQAPVGTGTAAPPPPATTSQPPISGGSRVLPGLSVALAIALVGVVAL
ncbi:cell wall protein [Trichoderma guizhouense]|uniref:Cell wall protein n=1 Tax=Trichoderma guizhouense TaxID=1491466 RepID=A0A1T3CHF0_9HYPO|nr:cell wall protein [Trichoderma guizhouense]